MKVYILEVMDAPEGDMTNLTEAQKEEFMAKAKELGQVYSLAGFQDALNEEYLFLDDCYILFN